MHIRSIQPVRGTHRHLQTDRCCIQQHCGNETYGPQIQTCGQLVQPARHRQEQVEPLQINHNGQTVKEAHKTVLGNRVAAEVVLHVCSFSTLVVLLRLVFRRVALPNPIKPWMRPCNDLRLPNEAAYSLLQRQKIRPLCKWQKKNYL